MPACFQVQGTINGYGERTGNADLIPITADLDAEDGRDRTRCPRARSSTSPSWRTTSPTSRTSLPTHVSPTRGATRSRTRRACTPAASRGVSRAYEHVPPETVGNRRGVVASDYGGGATIRMKAAELGLELADAAIPAAVEQIKERGVARLRVRRRRRPRSSC